MNNIGVCMLTGAFYPELSGGGGRQAQSLIHSLKDKFRFFVITTSQDRHLARYEYIEGVSVYRVWFRHRNILSVISALVAFTKIFYKIRKNVEILHLHGFTLKAIIFVILGKKFKKKIVQKITLLGDDDPISIHVGFLGRIKYFFFRQADAFISVSPALSLRYQQAALPQEKLFNIPNGVDVNKFTPVASQQEKDTIRNELGLPLQRKIIVSIGVFAPHKRLDLLVGAWKKIRDSYANKAYILFIGTTNKSHFLIEPRTIETICSDIAEFRAKGEMFLIDKTLNIEKYYRAADVFVLTSEREGLPNVLLEAMSSGLACIATKLEGVTDYVIENKKSGVLFNSGNVEQLSRELCGVLENAQFANEIGKEARKTIKDRFSLENISKEYNLLYNRLLQVGN